MSSCLEGSVDQPEKQVTEQNMDSLHLPQVKIVFVNCFVVNCVVILQITNVVSQKEYIQFVKTVIDGAGGISAVSHCLFEWNFTAAEP